MPNGGGSNASLASHASQPSVSSGTSGALIAASQFVENLHRLKLNIRSAVGIQGTKIDPILSYATLSSTATLPTSRQNNGSSAVPQVEYSDRIIHKVGRQVCVLDPETGSREFLDPNPLPPMGGLLPSAAGGAGGSAGGGSGNSKKTAAAGVVEPKTVLVDVLHFQMSEDTRFLVTCELVRPLHTGESVAPPTATTPMGGFNNNGASGTFSSASSVVTNATMNADVTNGSNGLRVRTGLGQTVNLGNGVGGLGSVVSIYSLTSLTRVKSLHYTTPPSTAGSTPITNPRAFVCGAFCGSGDSKLVAAMTDEPERIIVIWQWEKAKIYKTASIPTNISANILRAAPLHSGNGGSGGLFLSTSGVGSLRCWGLQSDGRLGSIPLLGIKEESGEIFLDHFWLPTLTDLSASSTRDGLLYRMLTLTEPDPNFDQDRLRRQHIYVFEGSEVVTPVPSSGSFGATGSFNNNNSAPPLVNQSSSSSMSSSTPGTVIGSGGPNLPIALEVRQVIRLFAGATGASAPRIEKVAPTSGGGFIAVGWHGTVIVFSRVSVGSERKGETPYQEVRRLQLGDGNFIGVSLSASEKRLLLLTRTMRLQTAAFCLADVLSGNFQTPLPSSPSSSCPSTPHGSGKGFRKMILSAATRPEDENGAQHGLPIDITRGDHHNLPIIASDMAYERPLLAVISNGGTVRVLNYLTGRTELIQHFTEEEAPHAVAFSGCGFNLLIATKDRVRAYNLLLDKMRPFRETALKAVRVLCYSGGGQYWAAAASLTVTIFESKSFTPLRVCSGHMMLVTRLLWAPGDQILFSAGSDGNVYGWPLTREGRIDVVTANNRSSPILDIAIDCNSTLALQSDDGEPLPETAAGVQARFAQLSSQPLTSLWPQRSWLIVSSQDGHLRLPAWSLEQAKPPHQTHNSTTTAQHSRMQISLAPSLVLARSLPCQDGVPVLYGDSTVTLTALRLSADRTKLLVGTSAGSLRLYPWPPEPAVLTSVAPGMVHNTPGQRASTHAASHVPSSSASTSDGSITDEANLAALAINFPYTHQSISVEVFCHSAPVVGIHMGIVENCVISTAADGSVFVHTLVEDRSRAKPTVTSTAVNGTSGIGNNSNGLNLRSSLLFDLLSDGENDEPVLTTEVVMLASEDIEANVAEVVELQKLLAETCAKNEFHGRKIDFEHNATLKQMKDGYDAQAAEKKATFESERAAFDRQIRELMHLEEAKDAEHVKEISALENSYEHRLSEEIDRYDRLADRMETLKERCNELLGSERQQFEKTLAEMEFETAQKEKRLKQESKRATEERTSSVAGFEEILRQQEAEYEAELTALINAGNEEITSVRDSMASLRDAIQTRNTKLDQLKKKFTELHATSKQRWAAIETQTAQQRALKEEIDSYKRTLLEREEALAEKEKAILELRSETRTLENFRFVLDFRLQELSAERGPITSHIENLEKHITAMYEELVEEFHAKQAAKISTAEKDELLSSLSSELASLRALEREKEQFITSFRREIDSIVSSMAVGNELTDAVNLLFKKFVRSKARVALSGTNTSGLSTGTVRVPGGGVNGNGPRGDDFEDLDDHLVGTGGKTSNDNSGNNGAVSATFVQEVTEAIDETTREATASKKFLERQSRNLAHRLRMTSKESTFLARHRLNENSSLLNECNLLRAEQREYLRKIEILQGELRESEVLLSDLRTEAISTTTNRGLSSSAMMTSRSVSTLGTNESRSQLRPVTSNKKKPLSVPLTRPQQHLVERLSKELTILQQQLSEEVNEQRTLTEELSNLRNDLSGSGSLL